MEAGDSERGANDPEGKAPAPSRDDPAPRSKPREEGDGQGLVGKWPKLLRGGLIALALLVGLIAWVATQGGDEDGEAPPAAVESPPRIVSAAELGEIAARTGNPVYWAGEMPGRALEATESSDGSIQVRYVEEGIEAGEGPLTVLTIGSYPLADPVDALETVAARPGAIVREAGGRKVATREGGQTSVYFASPDNSVQVEVYDPSPERAMRLALSDRVRPLG